MVATFLNFKDLRVCQHPTRVGHVEQKPVFEELHRKDWDSPCEGSGLFIELDDEQLVDQVSQGVEDGADEVHDGHPTAVHLDYEQGRHHSGERLLSLELFTSVQIFKIRLNFRLGVRHIIILVFRIELHVHFVGTVLETLENDVNEYQALLGIGHEGRHKQKEADGLAGAHVPSWNVVIDNLLARNSSEHQLVGGFPRVHTDEKEDDTHVDELHVENLPEGAGLLLDLGVLLLVLPQDFENVGNDSVDKNRTCGHDEQNYLFQELPQVPDEAVIRIVNLYFLLHQTADGTLSLRIREIMQQKRPELPYWHILSAIASHQAECIVCQSRITECVLLGSFDPRRARQIRNALFRQEGKATDVHSQKSGEQHEENGDYLHDDCPDQLLVTGVCEVLPNDFVWLDDRHHLEFLSHEPLLFGRPILLLEQPFHELLEAALLLHLHEAPLVGLTALECDEDVLDTR